jgi:hypothetical protein
MIARHEGDKIERIEEIERVIQSLMDQSPPLSAAFDRVNSVSSDMSQMSLNASGHSSEHEGAKPRRSPPLLAPHSTNVKELDRSRSLSNLSSSVSSTSSPVIQSGSEGWESSCTSVGTNSPVFRKSPMLSFRSQELRHAHLARSLPPLPSPIPSLPPLLPLLPLPLRRSASDDESIRLPPAAWDDNATIREKDTYSDVPAIPEPEPVLLKRSASTQTFEKELFKNSAIYCDLSVLLTPPIMLF